MLIRSQSVAPLLALVKSKGGDAAGLVKRFSLPVDAATSVDVELGVGVLNALFEQAAVEIGDPFVGVHTALSLQRGRYGLVEYGTFSAPSLRHALERLVRFSALVNRASKLELEWSAGLGAIRQRIPGHPDGLGRQANEFNMTALLQMGRAALVKRWAPLRVWFPHRAPPSVGLLEETFGTNHISFQADSCGMELDAALLDMPLPSSDPYLLALMDKYAQQEIAKLPTGEGLLPRVQKAVREMMRGGAPRLQDVARTLHMSPRTLQRHLGSEGVAFQEVVDGVRQEAARTLLGNPATPLAEVAFMLGYAEMGTFLRAFKRWTGTTPGGFRKGVAPRWKDAPTQVV